MNDRPLTVLQLSWSLMTGGLERVVLDLTRMGAGFGLRMAVATLEQGGPLAERARALGASFHMLGKRPGLEASVIARLANLLRRERVDVIHAHNQGAAFYGGLAGLICGRPLVVTRHGVSFGKDRSHVWLSRLATMLAHDVVCVGRDVCQAARRIDWAPAGKLRLIYNGVDTSIFRPRPNERQALRRELGAGPEEKLVISVGRMAPEKDYPTLLKAVAALAGQAPGCRLVMVGPGPELPLLEDLARKLDMNQRVVWLGERADIPELLAAADVFALSSRSEGVSIAILEAMASGLPVVATAVGGNAELVEQGTTGILSPPANPGALAQALLALLNDPARAEHMGQAGRARAQRNFSLEAMVRSYAGLYRAASSRRIGRR